MKPALSPIMAPDLVCMTCGQIMRREITVQQSNGRLDKIMYSCDTPKCQYTVSMTKDHSNVQDDKYVPVPARPNPSPEILTPGKGPAKLAAASPVIVTATTTVTEEVSAVVDTGDDV